MGTRRRSADSHTKAPCNCRAVHPTCPCCDITASVVCRNRPRVFQLAPNRGARNGPPKNGAQTARAHARQPRQRSLIPASQHATPLSNSGFHSHCSSLLFFLLRKNAASKASEKKKKKTSPDESPSFTRRGKQQRSASTRPPRLRGFIFIVLVLTRKK